MHKRRLLKLAELLEADAKDKKGICFDFSIWGRVTKPDEPMSCGTSACAMGLAAVSGAFKRQGLGYQLIGGSRLGITLARTKSPLRAAQQVFDISRVAAIFLFTESYNLPALHGAKAERAVAKRIRDFVAGKVSPP